MNAASTPRLRREGWPWPAPKDDADERARADEAVSNAALDVSRLTEQLCVALQQFEDAQREALLVAECAALREAGRLITRLRQPVA